MVIVLVSSLIIAENAPVISGISVEKPVEEDCLYYFYGVDCELCPETEEYILRLEQKYSHLQIQRFEIYRNKENADMLENYFTVYNVPKQSQSIPVIFISKSYFVGPDTIKSLLEDRIIDNKEASCPSLQQKGVIGVIGDGSPKDVLSTMTFASLTTSAFVDSFKPSAIALILVLLAGMFAIKNDDEMLKKGFLFILGIYTALILYGAGLFSAYERAGYFFYKIVGLMAVIFGLLHIKGFFATWKVWVQAFSKKTKANFAKFMELLTSRPGVFIVGFLISFFVFYELGSPFLTLQALVLERSTRWISWPLLLYYLFLFVLHLITIVLIVYSIRLRLHHKARKKGKSSEEKIEMWIKHHRKLLNFVKSIAMLIIGLIILFL